MYLLSIISHMFSRDPPPPISLLLLLLLIPLVSHLLPPFLFCLAPSTGYCWNCWNFCLTSSRQWPRLTVWCWPTCSRLRCSARAGLIKRASNSTSRLTSLPRSRRCCRSDMSNSDTRNVLRLYVLSIVQSVKHKNKY